MVLNHFVVFAVSKVVDVVFRLPPPVSQSQPPLPSLQPESLICRLSFHGGVPGTFNPRAVLPQSAAHNFSGYMHQLHLQQHCSATAVDPRPGLPSIVILIASNHTRSRNICATATPGPYLWKNVHLNHKGGAGLSTTCAQTAAFEANNPPHGTSAH